MGIYLLHLPLSNIFLIYFGEVSVYYVYKYIYRLGYKHIYIYMFVSYYVPLNGSTLIQWSKFNKWNVYKFVWSSESY